MALLKKSLLAIFVLLEFAYPNCGDSAQSLTALGRNADQALSRVLARQGTDLLKEGEYDGAILCLRLAIQCNDSDAGTSYDPWKFPPLSNDEIVHGQKQLHEVLTDRPLMGSFLFSSEELEKWTARKFSVKVCGSPINWDPTFAGNHGETAYHVIPKLGTPGEIHVYDCTGQFGFNDEQAFERMWSCLVVELHNIQFAEEFRELNKSVHEGKVSETEYVKGMFTIEWKAAQQTRRWYVEVFLPHAKKYGIQTNPLDWGCADWGTAEGVFSKFTDRSKYPWMPYLQYYDALKNQKNETSNSGNK